MFVAEGGKGPLPGCWRDQFSDFSDATARSALFNAYL
jgi:hypothetical protein